MVSALHSFDVGKLFKGTMDSRAMLMFIVPITGYDCGVFTCMFADFLSKDCPLVFSQEDINQCRERIVLSIMNGRAIM